MVRGWEDGEGPGRMVRGWEDGEGLMLSSSSPAGNFFLNKNMEVKIGDLGLAARVGPAGRCHR